MTTTDTPFAAGTPCWVDLHTCDAPKSKTFHSGLFGWSVAQGGEEFGGYANFAGDGHWFTRRDVQDAPGHRPDLKPPLLQATGRPANARSTQG